MLSCAPMRRLLSLFACALLFSGCAKFVDETGPPLQQAMGIEITPEEVDSITPPQVSYSAEVILARAEGHFGLRQFVEAAGEYARFMELHAAHEWAAYAAYREGMCHVHQIKSADRNPGTVQRARRAFEIVIANYPDSPAVPYAREQLTRMIDLQAIHELEVARFYLRTHKPKAALTRLRYLADTYPDSAAARGEGIYLTGKALEATGDPEGAMALYREFLELPDLSEKLRKQAMKSLKRLLKA